MSMGSSGFAPPPLEELPIPKAEDAPVEVKPAVPVLQQPPGAGYAGRTGQVANIAANFLQGWLGGKAAKEIKERAQALDEVKGTRAAVDVSIQTVHKLTNDGVPDTDPRMAQAKAALTSAWTNYTGTMERYAFPTDDKGKPIKQGVGSRLKGAVMGDIPHMFSMAAIETLKKTNPLDLVPSQSPQERVANAQAGELERTVKERKQYGDALKTPEAQRTPEQKQYINYFEEAVLNRGAKQRVQDSVFAKIEKGQSLSDQEKETVGFQIDRPSVSVIQDRDGTYNSVAIDKMGTVLSVKPLMSGGKPIRGPVQNAGAGLQNYRMMQQIQVENLKKAHPEWTEAQIFQGITGTIPNTAYADNAGEISGVLKSIVGQNPKFGNFALTNSMTGDVVLRSAIPDAQNTHPIAFWKPDEFYGGATKDELPALEDQFRSILKTQLEQRFKGKYTPEQIQAMLGQPLTQNAAAPTPPPGTPPTPAPQPGVNSQGSVPQTLPPPPGTPAATGPGAQPSQLYTVTLANGQSQQMTLSAEQIKMIQAQDPSVKIAAAKQTAAAKKPSAPKK